MKLCSTNVPYDSEFTLSFMNTNSSQSASPCTMNVLDKGKYLSGRLDFLLPIFESSVSSKFRSDKK
jgi:hypothetical protein